MDTEEPMGTVRARPRPGSAGAFAKPEGPPPIPPDADVGVEHPGCPDGSAAASPRARKPWRELLVAGALVAGIVGIGAAEDLWRDCQLYTTHGEPIGDGQCPDPDRAPMPVEQPRPERGGSSDHTAA